MEPTMRGTARSEPLGRDNLFRQIGPLIGGVLLIVISLAMAQASRTDTPSLVKAAILTALTIAAMAFVPWRHLPEVLRAGPAIAYLAVTFLIRQATGGPESIYAMLVLLPILWLAVYGSNLEVGLGIAGIAVALLGPVFLVPGAEAQLPRALLLTVAAGVLGYGVQKLFTRLRAHSDQLIVLTHTDPLTGAANRRAWDEELALTLARSEGGRIPVSVAMIDLDHFKAFNDARGHQAGDRLLKETTAVWRSRLREGDTLARLGGDEFAVLLPRCSLDAAAGILERLCTDLPVGQTCSTGLATWDAFETPDELIARADAALYRAKQSGRARIVPA